MLDWDRKEKRKEESGMLVIWHKGAKERGQTGQSWLDKDVHVNIPGCQKFQTEIQKAKNPTLTKNINKLFKT